MGEHVPVSLLCCHSLFQSVHLHAESWVRIQRGKRFSEPRIKRETSLSSRLFPLLCTKAWAGTGSRRERLSTSVFIGPDQRHRQVALDVPWSHEGS